MTTVAITNELIKKEANSFDLDSIFQLKLEKKSLNDLGCLQECVYLEILDLSHNHLQEVVSLKYLFNLKYLNLSSNYISNIDGIQYLEQLRTLNLAGNLISSMKSIELLATLRDLTHLRLLDNKNNLKNPICANLSYRDDICSIMLHLEQLDDEFLKTKYTNIYETLNKMDNQHEAETKSEIQTSIACNEPWFTKEDLQPIKADMSEVYEGLDKLSESCEKSVAYLDDLQKYLNELETKFKTHDCNVDL